MAVALGVLGWRPGEFWAASMAEFVAAHRGWLRLHGLSEHEPERMSRDDLAALMDRYPDA